MRSFRERMSTSEHTFRWEQFFAESVLDAQQPAERQPLLLSFPDLACRHCRRTGLWSSHVTRTKAKARQLVPG